MGKTKVRREIYGMDFAICHLVTTLDETFLHPLLKGKMGWKPASGMMRYEAWDREGAEGLQKYVSIYPKNWPNDGSHIACRIGSYTPGIPWAPEEGSLVINYSDTIQYSIPFKFHFETISYITPSNPSQSEAEIMLEAARLRRPDLAKKGLLDL